MVGQLIWAILHGQVIDTLYNLFGPAHHVVMGHHHLLGGDIDPCSRAKPPNCTSGR